MYRICEKVAVGSDVVRFAIEAPQIAARQEPGQFVIVRTHEEGERIPLTIAGADPSRGTIDLVVQLVGHGTRRMGDLNCGDVLADIVGPLGKATEIEPFGTVACVGGGVGTAVVYPVAAAMRAGGNRVIGVIGARNESLLILEAEMAKVCDRVEIATDDGSRGYKGFVSGLLKELMEGEDRPDRVLAAGPVPMMRAVAETTRPAGIPTVVSLNPIMLDGTGMCGGCRVTVGGERKFACVDGPEFDAHRVDFEELMSRLAAYDSETQARRKVNTKATCHVEPEGKPAGKGRTPRQAMPERPPEERIADFGEVPRGYDTETAAVEAGRCLQCKKPACVDGCPVRIDIPGFLKQIEEGDVLGAAATLKESNSLPAVCGRVCPQEDQCELACVLGRKGQPVAIGNLERFAADYERSHGAPPAAPSARPEPLGRVAVVGSGPAGLTAAGDLAKMGFETVIFEALHETGGVLRYGIPEFRMPKKILDAEVDYVRSLGVRVETNAVIGKTRSVEDLLDGGFDAVFVGTGAGLPYFMRVPGENLKGVFSANEFLARVNLMKAYDPGTDTPLIIRDHVAVIGGGNVAMDAARTAVRLGADRVDIVYRRSAEEMPARKEEIRHAKEEGVNFIFLASPVEVVGDADGWVKALRCIRMELGEPDASGRRRPVPIEGSEFDLNEEMVIVAIGNGPNPLIPATTPGLETTRHGTIVADEETGRTTCEGIFAGGDIVTGAATVILAMGAGRAAANAIQAYLGEGGKK
jgi:glutamate synthase (NADPH/NADH) small chain